MADRTLLYAAIDRCNIAEDLRLLARAVDGDREVLKLLQVLYVILRRLHSDVVADMILRIEIERRRRLKAAAQAGQHIAGHVVLAVANLLCARAVDIYRPVRQIEGLLDSQVGGARNMADLLHHMLGQIVVLLDCIPDHLHVDLRRQAEVQDLAHHVRGQVVELRTRKLPRQLVAQIMRVFVGGPMLFRQRYQNVCVSRTHGRRVRVGKIQA